MINRYDKFLGRLNEFAAPRIPKSIDYWVNQARGKKGKDVMIYFHDDLDGIFSCIAIKNHLINQGFNIEGYGIINYQEGWGAIELDPETINICVDFADNKEGVDVYIDHHGDAFDEENMDYAVKTKTASCYEGIMVQIGKPVDKMVLDVINMVDSAKYDEYGIEWHELMNFDMTAFKNSANPKLAFAGAFNQLLKRSDYKTFIEVVHNASGNSIYEIFHLFKIIYPMNNADPRTQVPKQFVDDGKGRMVKVKNRMRGRFEKVLYRDQESFAADFARQGGGLKIDGYQIIGKLAFVPSGTWANPIRARSVIQEDLIAGNLPDGADPLWILLQYGNTLQVCMSKSPRAYNTNDFPMLDGDRITSLGTWTERILGTFIVDYGYNVLEDADGNPLTVAGGHVGIGTVNNIVGEIRFEAGNGPFRLNIGTKYLDAIKNLMIKGLSGVRWDDLNMTWGDPNAPQIAKPPAEPNKRVMKIEDIRNVRAW